MYNDIAAAWKEVICHCPLQVGAIISTRDESFLPSVHTELWKPTVELKCSVAFDDAASHRLFTGN